MVKVIKKTITLRGKRWRLVLEDGDRSYITNQAVKYRDRGYETIIINLSPGVYGRHAMGYALYISKKKKTRGKKRRSRK